MKRKRLLFLLLLALMAPWAANAQTTVTIGEGTATCNTNPIGTYYNYSIAEQLYTAEEIGTAGTISSISFYYMGIAAKDLPITVYMKHVDEANLASAGITLADADEVFSGTLSVTTTAGWVTIDLATPFAYNGTSNLLIGFVKDYLYYFSGQSWQGTATTATMARYTQNDYNAYTTSTVPSYEQANRPNIQIEITPTGGGPTCTKPSTLDVTDITGFGATCTWENTGAASYTFEWKKASDSNYTVVSGLTANTYALSSLEPMTAYSVRVKAVCDTDLESGYKSATFTTLEVCPDGKVCIGQGTATNSYLPTYCYYNYSLTQQIYNAEEIGDAGLIESIDFYCSAAGTRNLDIYMVTTDKDVFASTTDWIAVTPADLVFSGNVTTTANAWTTITFDNPFIFMGRTNIALIVDDNTGSYVSAPNFYVFDAEGNQAIRIYSDDTNYNPENPTQYTGIQMNVKNRVRLGVSELPSCFPPTGLTVSDVEARQAVLSWTQNGEATAWDIDVNGTVTAISQNPYTLVGLEPDTEYSVRVRANCGDGDYSEWSVAVTFTTEPSCYAPTDMVISDITAFSANVAWTSDNTNFELRYSPDVRPITTFDDSQMHGWTNIDADGDGYEWVLGSECGGIYLVEGGSLAGSGHNSSADMVTSGSYSNATSAALTPDNYLVSPQITLGGSISFWAQAQDASYAAEHFGVAVSTTGNTDAADFTTIAEWTIGSRSANVLRSSNAPRGGNRAQSEWVLYTVDLSAYSGQGYVAIRHFDCTDQFMLNVDDIFIEQPGFEMPWVYVTNPASPQALTNLEPETDYIVQVRANCGGEDGYSQWLEGTFTTLPSCMVPTNLVISNIDKRSADLAWTANGDEEAWQIEISDSQNPPVVTIYDVTTTSFTLPGLQPETRYSVRVRAVCDETLQSAWSTPTTFTTLVACPAPTNLAISDITNVSAVASWTGEGDFELQYAEDVWTYYDNGVYALTMGAGGTLYWGMMLPAESLTAGEPLTKVALHTTYAGEAEMNIYLGGDQPTGTPAATQTFTMAGDGDFMEITLDTPVAIDGTQNLWITFYQSGLTYPADGCTGPTDPNGRWVSLDGETWSDIADYGYDYTWMIRAAFGNASTEWVTIDNATSPQAITGLTPETNYLVRVKHVCGGIDGESVWVTTSFTTDIACPAPYALAATPYANSAVLSWEGISESYTVSYREPAVIGGIDEKFATSSAPTGWTRSNTLLTDDVLNGTTALATYNGGWNFGTSNGVFDSHARVNIYGTSCKYWLVTPAIEVPTRAEFSFDLALTGYSGTLVAPATTGTDDRFVVLVSTDEKATWSILRQWDNAGSEYVYNNITCSATGENVSFDFSAYAGQTVYVAFYGESTESNADNNLHIDNVNVTVAELVPAGEWMTVDADEAAATLTGLTPATKYEWKVQGDCGDFGMSEESAISSFTTTEDTCPTPTNLTVDAETLTFNTADLSWNGSPDVESFTVRYRVPEHAAAGSFYEPFNNSGVPAGWTRYSGLVDDVVAGTATLSSTTSGWIFSNTNVFGQYHAKVNIYGTGCKYWLVTPEVTPTSGTFSFDLALTDFSNADPIEDPTAQADDRFVVLVYADSTWTILREWNNSGSDYVYNNIATTGEHVSIDLSDYVGQAVQIAFYGESTVSSNGDNDLHIDNVLIGEMIPATDWQMVEGITDMNVTLTGLTPETLYEAQVKSDCSDPEAWSTALNFTTAPLPIQTIALAEGWNWFSTYIDISLNDLKAALIEALPDVQIVIKGKNNTTTYDPVRHRWNGSLPWNVSLMYEIKAASACEISLQGVPVNPADHPVSIVNGANWIAFPLQENMSLTNAFAGFAINGDAVKSKNNTAQYIRGRWQGAFLLEPGKGYIYKSTASGTRTFTFPTSAK